MEMIFIGWLLGIGSLLIGYFIGWQAGRGSLQEKMKKVFQVRRQEESKTGPVIPLDPVALQKKQSRDIFDKFT